MTSLWWYYFGKTAVLLISIFNGLVASFMVISRVEEILNHLAFYRNRLGPTYHRDPMGTTYRHMTVSAVCLILGAIGYTVMYNETQQDFVLRWMFHYFNFVTWVFFLIQLGLCASMIYLVRRARKTYS